MPACRDSISAIDGCGNGPSDSAGEGTGNSGDSTSTIDRCGNAIATPGPERAPATAGTVAEPQGRAGGGSGDSNGGCGNGLGVDNSSASVEVVVTTSFTDPMELELEQEVPPDVTVSMASGSEDPKTSTPFPNPRSSFAPFSPIPFNIHDEPDFDMSNNNDVTECADVTCNFVNESLSNAKKSNGAQPKLIFQCDRCDYVTSKKSNLKRHEELHGSGQWHTCELCKFQSKRKDNLKRHIESKHKANTVKRKIKNEQKVLKMLSCDQCSYKTIKTNHLKRHITAKHTDLKFSCNQCDFTSNRRDSVKRHEQLIHKFY